MLGDNDTNVSSEGVRIHKFTNSLLHFTFIFIIWFLCLNLGAFLFINRDTGDDNTRLYRVWFRDSSWFSDELTMLYFWSISHLWLLVSEEYVHKQRHMWALKPSLEAFAFQYEMHASSYQINIATAQQVAKENGPPEDCTRGKYLSTIMLRLLLF